MRLPSALGAAAWRPPSARPMTLVHAPTGPVPGSRASTSCLDDVGRSLSKNKHRRLVPSKILPGEEKKIQNGASFDRTGSLPAAPGDPMLLPCTRLNRHWDGVGVLVMARRKSGACLPPQPSALMKFAAGSTWTCMKTGDAQDMLPSTYQPPEWTSCVCS